MFHISAAAAVIFGSSSPLLSSRGCLAKMMTAAASSLLSSPGTPGPGKPGFGFGFPFRSCCRVHCHSGYIYNTALSVFEVSEKRSLVRRSPVWHEKVWLHSKKKKVIHTMGLSAASARHFKGAAARTSALRSSSGERETVSVDLSPWENHVVLSRDPSVILIKNMIPNTQNLNEDTQNVDSNIRKSVQTPKLVNPGQNT